MYEIPLPTPSPALNFMQMLQSVANLNQTQNSAQQTAIQNQYLPSALNSANQTAAFLAKNPTLPYNPQIGTTLALTNGSFDKNGLPTTFTDTSSSSPGSSLGSMFSGWLNKIMPGKSSPVVASQATGNQNSSLSSSFPSPYANNAAISQYGSAPAGSSGLDSAIAMNNLNNNLLYANKINDTIKSYQSGLTNDQVAADSARASALYGGNIHDYWANRSLGKLTQAQQDKDAQAQGYPDFQSVPGIYPQSTANVTATQAKAIGDAGFNAISPIVSKGLASFSSPVGQHLLLNASMWDNWINKSPNQTVQSAREDRLGQALAARTMQNHQAQLGAMAQGGSITDSSVKAQAQSMGNGDYSSNEFASTPGLYQKYQYYLTKDLHDVLDAQRKQVLAKDTLNPGAAPSENQFSSKPSTGTLSGQTVMVTDGKGNHFNIPVENVGQALKRGYTRS